MRIIAMADSHGNLDALKKIFEQTSQSGNIFVHLGDGLKELETIKKEYTALNIREVAGNCDYRSTAKAYDFIFAGGAKILITHGHKYGVSYGMEELTTLARVNGCNVALFGHTHCRCSVYENGIYFLNPGSCASPRDFSKPSYGYVDITPQGILTNIVDI